MQYQIFHDGFLWLNTQGRFFLACRRWCLCCNTCLRCPPQLVVWHVGQINGSRQSAKWEGFHTSTVWNSNPWWNSTWSPVSNLVTDMDVPKSKMGRKSRRLPNCIISTRVVSLNPERQPTKKICLFCAPVLSKLRFWDARMRVFTQWRSEVDSNKQCAWF